MSLLGRWLLVAVNFAVHSIGADSGPMRDIPGTQMASARARWYGLVLPDVDDEPLEWQHSMLYDLEPGDAIIRDVRVLHGGTPNRSSECRYLPSLEFALSAYIDSSEYYRWPRQESMPWCVFDVLPRRVQSWCSGLVARGELKTGWKENRGSDWSIL